MNVNVNMKCDVRRATCDVPRGSGPRFAVHSFGYVVSINLNVEATKCLLNLINSQSDVGSVLYTLARRLEDQLDKFV